MKKIIVLQLLFFTIAIIAQENDNIVVGFESNSQ